MEVIENPSQRGPKVGADPWVHGYSAERCQTDSNTIQWFQIISNPFKLIQTCFNSNRTFQRLKFLKENMVLKDSMSGTTFLI
jgi:hypothetical protein